MPSPAQIKDYALQRAAELGFACAGVAPAGPAEHWSAFETWLRQGRHASMDYLARHADLRRDVRNLEPWTRSVLCLAGSYAPLEQADAAADAAVARYARGRDYHKTLKTLAQRLADDLRAAAPGLQTRVCVDTAPVLEREYAWRAGLGWIGRSGCLIHPRHGSCLLLAEILLSEELPPDAPMPDHCGRCRACLDACPTGALVGPRELDARRCVSWATIEHRGELSGEGLNLGGMLFGCDACQCVCPFNRKAPKGLPSLTEPTSLADAAVPEVLGWSRDDWDRRTRGSAGRRATWEMYLRNACIVAGQQRLPEMRAALVRLSEHEHAIVRSAAQWALRRL